MRHYAARAKESNGRWDYTVAHDGAIYPVGYCVGRFEAYWPEHPGANAQEAYGGVERYQEARARELEHAAKYHDDGHATAAEACACYKAFVLDHEIRYIADAAEGQAETLHRCEAPDCTDYTSGGAVWSGTSRPFNLCAAHRTREIVDALIGDIGQSWRS